MKVEESLNVTFDETPPPPKTSPLEDDDLFEEEAIEVNKTKPLGNDLEDKSLENNEIINIKESKSRPLDNVISNLNQRTLRSQAQDKNCEDEFVGAGAVFAVVVDVVGSEELEEVAEYPMKKPISLFAPSFPMSSSSYNNNWSLQ
nr:hypothetical protein CTI12_AA182560 [Tanacetum cinerariifolium]